MQKSQFDIVVCGGGPSGIFAAWAAARLGQKVLLIERHGFLGGMPTAALVGPIMTFYAGKLQTVRGYPGMFFEELRKIGGTPGHLQDPIWGTTSMTPVDTEAMKSQFLKVLTEAGVRIQLHSLVLDGQKEEKIIRSIRVVSKEGIQSISGECFIDATGDGDLAAHIGCEFHLGRASDQKMQPLTLMFKVGGVDEEAVRDAIRKDPDNFYFSIPIEEALRIPCLAVAGFFKEVAQARKSGAFPTERDRILFFGLPRKGEVTVNTLRIQADATKIEELTRAEIQLRSSVQALRDFMKEKIPGFRNSYVIETAAQIGVRETRHILGEYLLSRNDVLSRRRFPDVIAHANYPIDLHSPDGAQMEIVKEVVSPESTYDIPFGCLVPKGISNLLVAGRCISAEHEASASARISATCMALGQAAGTAASVFVKNKTRDFRNIDVREVQNQLLKDGAYLKI